VRQRSEIHDIPNHFPETESDGDPAETTGEALARNPRAELVVMERGRHGALPAGFEARLAEFFLLYVK